MMIKVS